MTRENIIILEIVSLIWIVVFMFILYCIESYLIKKKPIYLLITYTFAFGYIILYILWLGTIIFRSRHAGLGSLFIDEEYNQTLLSFVLSGVGGFFLGRWRLRNMQKNTKTNLPPLQQ